jgi:hypothetical protein
LKRIRILSSILGVVAVVTFLSLGVVSLTKIRSDSRRKEAEKLKEEYAARKTVAEEFAVIAVKRSVESDSVANIAATNEKQERQLRETVESQFNSAKAEAARAVKRQTLADAKAEEALQQKNETQRMRMVSVAKSMSLKSLQVTGQNDLQALLAYGRICSIKRTMAGKMMLIFTPGFIMSQN